MILRVRWRLRGHSGCARAANHGIAFVWEPTLSALGSTKPLSDEEASIHPIVKRGHGEIAQYERSRGMFNAYTQSRGILHVDPTEALKTHGETVFIDYAHYTPDGNRFIAGVVYNKLRPVLLARFRRER